MRGRLRSWLRRGALSVAVLTALYLLLLTYPQPLFAYELNHAGIRLHATRPIPDAMRATLERARARLDRTSLYDPSVSAHVFVCEPQWLFALFARQNYRVGGIADWVVGQHVFLRESDMHNDRLISPGGTPVAADRALSYFIAHEVMHIANARALGRAAFARTPQWVDDGLADYVARDIDLSAALRKLKEGARELDPARSGLYLRYHLMVAYAIEKKGIAAGQLLRNPPARDALERELLALPAW